MLALRGDPPDGQPEWHAREGGYSHAYELVEQIRRLNDGCYLRRLGDPPVDQHRPTDFCIGVAAYAEHPDVEEGVAFFARKVEAGAEFAITQMVFDAEAYARFLDRCGQHGLDVPILPGTRVLRSRLQARRTAEKYGVSVPRVMFDRLGRIDQPGAAERALDLFERLVERLRSYGAPGAHLFVSDTTTACALLHRLRRIATK